eukprot:TRINITY_DN2072_c1_g2_i1.p1 TRINITY_DN2072_c1_g2~~TRINITY_DN2072_c1_g2_i1.p1  ORF type:complete len:103 (+),score=21.17 TRINITY_DN2072_c1_g2_i1:26-334(+)
MFGGGKMSDQRLLSIGMKFFIAGFFFLPGIHLLMLCYFKKYWKRDTKEMEKVRKMCYIGAVSSVVEVCCVLVWLFVYVYKWRGMGAAGEALAIVTIKGDGSL